MYNFVFRNELFEGILSIENERIPRSTTNASPSLQNKTTAPLTIIANYTYLY